MASPIGHSLAGLAVGLALAPLALAAAGLCELAAARHAGGRRECRA